MKLKGSHWLPLTYPSSSATRSKSSCSPDLGIESDAALTSTRPLKNTLKITESMTNLLSDDDNCNNNPGIVETDSESPLPIEGNSCLFFNYFKILKFQNVKKLIIITIISYIIGGLIYSMY